MSADYWNLWLRSQGNLKCFVKENFFTVLLQWEDLHHLVMPSPLPKIEILFKLKDLPERNSGINKLFKEDTVL